MAVLYDGQNVLKILRGTNADVDLASIGAAASFEFTIAVPGAKVGDLCVVNPSKRLNAADSATTTTCGYYCRVSAADTVTVHVTNPSAAAIDVQNDIAWTALVVTTVP